jgi:hypothetical protein
MMRPAFKRAVRYLRRERALTVATSAFRLWESRAMILDSRRSLSATESSWARNAKRA